MKSIWKGSISFGLVSIPVRLYSAIQAHALSFNMLHAKCHTPVQYERWCPHCKKEVEWSQIVKGYKLENGEYVVLTHEKLQQLRPQTSDTISIIEFVATSSIEPIYLEHHFYLGPEKAGEKSFALFKKALQDARKVAIGTFVMRDKEYACMINPYGDAMLLSTLNYSYEIRDVTELPNLGAVKKLSSAEITLAKQLIDKLTVKKFNLAQFKDTFAEQLKAVLKKSKKEKILASKKITKEKSAAIKKKKEKEPSLATALRASLMAPGKSGEMARAKSAKKRR
jgi:DNA end-binding protein Ku